MLVLKQANTVSGFCPNLIQEFDVSIETMLDEVSSRQQ